jgi:hypothetical protein
MMIFQLLIQRTNKGFANRMMACLVCEACFEEMVEGLTLADKSQSSGETKQVLVSDVITQMGEITWLAGAAREASHQKCQDRGWGEINRERDPTWELILRWQDTGAWTALQSQMDEFQRSLLSESGDFHVHMSKSKTAKTCDQFFGVLTPIEMHKLYGVVYNGPHCDKQYGISKVKLSKCKGCMKARYCSIECMISHWPEHEERASRSGDFVQLLYTTFLHGYFDSRVPRPIDGNKRRFRNAPVSWILSLEPELFTIDSSRRPSREARARARGACNFSI